MYILWDFDHELSGRYPVSQRGELMLNMLAFWFIFVSISNSEAALKWD